MPSPPPGCVFVAGTRVGGMPIPGRAASAKGLLGADKYGQELSEQFLFSPAMGGHSNAHPEHESRLHVLVTALSDFLRRSSVSQTSHARAPVGHVGM